LGICFLNLNCLTLVALKTVGHLSVETSIKRHTEYAFLLIIHRSYVFRLVLASLATELCRVPHVRLSILCWRVHRMYARRRVSRACGTYRIMRSVHVSYPDNPVTNSAGPASRFFKLDLQGVFLAKLASRIPHRDKALNCIAPNILVLLALKTLVQLQHHFLRA
jgi:hypothetical protein